MTSREIRKALRRTPPEDDFSRAGRWRSYALVRRAERILDAGDWAEGTRLLKKALTIDPESHTVRAALATILVSRCLPNHPAHKWGLEQLDLARKRSEEWATCWDPLWYTCTYRLVDARHGAGDYQGSQPLARELQERIDIVLAELRTSTWWVPLSRRTQAARRMLEEFVSALAPAVTVMHAATLLSINDRKEAYDLLRRVEGSNARSALVEYNLACFYSIEVQTYGAAQDHVAASLRHLSVAMQIGESGFAALARTDRSLAGIRAAAPRQFEECISLGLA